MDRSTELTHDLRKAQAAQECRNLIGRYQFYYAAYRMKDAVSLFADGTDTELEMPWGCYHGINGVQRCLLEDLYDREDERFSRLAGGRLLLHYADTGMLEVADDLMTARGLWRSPGADCWDVDGRLQGQWTETKIACDFLWENGIWKIWKLRILPVFTAVTGRKSWSEMERFDFIDVPVHPDAPPSGEPLTLPDPYGTYAGLPSGDGAEDSTAMTDEELELGFRRLDAVRQCRNLMGVYQLYHLQFRHREYVALWADREDDILEMPWGTYHGIKGVTECYLVDHADCGDENFSTLGLPFHHVSTEVIEVAEDCKTARGVWMSQGNEIRFADDTVPRGGARWTWCRYAVDFLLEDGVWKIWRMRLYPTFQCQYGANQVDENIEETLAAFDGDNNISSPWWSYRKTSFFPPDQPEPPLPYKTYADVGWKHGQSPFAV